MNHYRLMGITVLLAALTLPAKAVSGREAITAVQIAAAIRDAGLNVSAEQVTLLSDVLAKTSAPALRVESVGPWERNLARVRLGCFVSDECLPFVVTVHRAQNDEPGGTFVPLGQQPSRRSPVDTPKGKVIVRAGSPAVLLLDGGHVHIQLAVICLENGFVGQTIRVAGKGHEQTYMAEVCSDGLLRGTL
jgi:hypothetical protein